MITSRSLEKTGSVYDVGKNGGLNKSPTSKEICETHVAERTRALSPRQPLLRVHHLLTGEGTLPPPVPRGCGRGFRLESVTRSESLERPGTTSEEHNCPR